MSSLPQSAEMPKGCLFPDLIPNRDVIQRYLAQLTREGSYKLGGFHCLLPKDRITWGDHYIVHVYYIHVRTVVKEPWIKELGVCTSKELLLSFLSSKAQDWSLIWWVPAREPERSTTTITMTIETPQKWPGAQGLLSHHISSCLRTADPPSPLGTSQFYP